MEQVARVTRAFTDAGIMVHAYFMYGFPTETEQDTVDALGACAPAVRGGLHSLGVLASLHGDGALANRLQPERYGITLRPPPMYPVCPQRHRLHRSRGYRSRILGQRLTQSSL